MEANEIATKQDIHELERKLAERFDRLAGMMNEKDEMWGTTEVKDYLNCSVSTARRKMHKWYDKGWLPHADMNGQLKAPASEIKEALRKQNRTDNDS